MLLPPPPIHPLPPTLSTNIIPTFAAPCPHPLPGPPLFRAPQYSPSKHCSRVRSDPVVKGRQGCDIKSTGVDYTWKPWLLHSISCGALCKSSTFSWSQFSQFALKEGLDWVTAPRAFEFPALGIQTTRRWASASRDIPETRRSGLAESFQNVARLSGGRRGWAGTAAREARATHGERRSPRARAAPSGPSPLAGPNLQTPPCWSHMTAPRDLRRRWARPPRQACWDL